MRTYLAICVAAAVAALWGFEGWLAFNEPVRSFPARVWYERFHDEIDSGKMPLVLGGLSNTRSLLCLESEGSVSYNSDLFGFRNSRDHAYVVLIGDSFAKGQCHPRPLADLLDARTFGTQGNGPLLELASLVEYALPERPKAVVWMFYEGNDLSDLASESRSPLLRGYLEGKTNRLRDRQPEIEASIREGQAEVNREMNVRSVVSLSRTRQRLGLLGITDANSPRPDMAQLPLLAQVLRYAADQTRAAGARFLFLYIPAPDRLSGQVDYFAGVEKTVMHAACAARAEIVTALFTVEDYNIFAHRYGHWAEGGQQRAADAIKSALTEPKRCAI